jgi:hypothetical protein
VLRALGLCARFNGVQFLAGLEPDSFSWGDADFGSGAGIATDAGFAGADAEDSESAKLDALACSQSLLESFEDGVNSGFCLCTRQAGALDHVMDDVLFNQWGNLAGATEYDFTTTYRGDATDFGSNMEQQNGFMAVFPLRKCDLCGPEGVLGLVGLIRLSTRVAVS